MLCYNLVMRRWTHTKILLSTIECYLTCVTIGIITFLLYVYYETADFILYYLKDNPFACNALRSLEIELGPMPCKLSVSVSVNCDNCSRLFMPFVSKARLAGAANKERKPFSGLRSCSQIGQVGQSLLLRYLCPFLQVLTLFVFVIIVQPIGEQIIIH